MDADRKSCCRAKLIEVAKRRDTITYGDLAVHLGIANQGPWGVLDELYREETSAGRLDLTLVVVYAGPAKVGKFNSASGPAGSVTVDPRDPEQVKAYQEALAHVWDQWAEQ